MTSHLEGWISPYIDDELEEKDRIMVEKHLEECSQCQSIFEDLVNIQNQVKVAYHSIEIPDGLDAKVMHAIHFESEPKTYLLSQKSWFVVPAISILSLVAFSIIILGFILFKPVSVLFRVMFNVVFALGSVISNEPLLVGGSVLFSLFLIIASGFSIRRILVTKTVEGV